MEISESHAKGLRKIVFDHVRKSDAKGPKLAGYLKANRIKFRDAKTQVSYAAKVMQYAWPAAWYIDNTVIENQRFMCVIPCLSKVKTSFQDGAYAEEVIAFFVLIYKYEEFRNIYEMTGGVNISAHAIERVFMRMKSNDVNAVKNMIGRSLFWINLVYISLHPYSRDRRPKRFSVPAYGGVFIVEADNNADIFLIRTFIIPEQNSWLDKSRIKSEEILNSITWSNYTKLTQRLFALPENKWWFEYENRELSRLNSD